MTGTDLTQIDGIDVMTAMTVVSEVGWDMSKWAQACAACSPKSGSIGEISPL
jgi:hypothetical protein